MTEFLTRWSATALVLLSLVAATEPASARQPSDFKVSEQVVLQCVEAAERSNASGKADQARDCIGRETETCLSVMGAGGPTDGEVLCASSETAAWYEIGKKAYAALLAFVAKEDKAKPKGMQPALPALHEAHKKWEAAAGDDCIVARLRSEQGIPGVAASARCWRDKHAERALLYRRWLRGAAY
jgi:hypothetical protein